MKPTIIEIETCKECFKREVGPLYTTNGLDVGADWLCGAMDMRLIAEVVERPRDEPRDIPGWCPLRSK